MRNLFRSVWFMGLITLIIFPLLAWMIFYFTGQNFINIFSFEFEDLFTIQFFLAAGILFALLVIYLTELPYFEKSLAKYRSMLSHLKFTKMQAIFLAFCAGFGEEIFFRGAIQPYAGIWITAIFFVLIHGYFSLKNIPVNIFAASLILFISLLGWAAREYSIWHAIAGHFSYDLILLFYHRRTV